MEDDKMCCVLLDAGTVAHVNGVPVELAEGVAVSTHPANVPLLFGVGPDAPDVCGACDAPTEGSAAAAARFDGPLRAILLRRLKARSGASEADCAAALDAVAGARPLLDWLRDGGLEKLIQMVLAVLKLLA